MELKHRFTVPVQVDKAWAEFKDIGSIAECFPGAQSRLRRETPSRAR